MPLESLALGTIDIPPNYEVHHFVDRTQVLEIGVVVLGEYKIVDPLESGAAKGRKGTFLVLTEDHV